MYKFKDGDRDTSKDSTIECMVDGTSRRSVQRCEIQIFQREKKEGPISDWTEMKENRHISTSSRPNPAQYANENWPPSETLGRASRRH